MSQPIVLVAFACQSGDIEKIALNAAVGAVQARALIRLRRVPELEAVESTEAAIRMRKEYIGPAEGDVLGADALILASNTDAGESSVQWNSFLDLLRRLGNEGKLKGKVAAAIGGLFPSLTSFGFVTVLQAGNDPLTLGRSVAEKARSMKSS